MGNQATEQEKKHISANILTLRRRLKISQKVFIDTYLEGEEKEPLISVATLSNIENGSQARVDRIADQISGSMGVDSQIFRMDPDLFAKNIELFFEKLIESGCDSATNRFIQARKTSNVEALVIQISDYLTDGIISGELHPGDKLPSDRNFSAMFGAGRTSVREALKALSTLGLIHILPGQGTFVASESTDFFLVPLSWTFLIGSNNTDNIIDVRNVLEIESARLAGDRADKKAMGELADLYGKMTEAYQESDFKAFLSLDLDFHMAIACCSGNSIIRDLLQTSRKLLSYISKSGVVTVEHLQEIFKEHGEIYNAITDADSTRAKQAMENHLSNAKKRYSVRHE